MNTASLNSLRYYWIYSWTSVWIWCLFLFSCSELIWVGFTHLFLALFVIIGDVYPKQGSCDDDHRAAGHWGGPGWWPVRCAGKDTFTNNLNVCFFYTDACKYKYDSVKHLLILMHHLLMSCCLHLQCLSSYMEQFVGTESSLCSQAEGYFFKPVFLPR